MSYESLSHDYGCGCGACASANHDSSHNHDNNDQTALAVLSGGGGTVTPAAIGVNNALELLSGLEWGPGNGTAVSVTYGFPTSVPSYYPGDALERTQFEAFSTSMQNAVRQIMTHIETFANITLTETSSNPDISLAQAYLSETPDDQTAAYAYFPDQGPFSGDVWFNNRFFWDSTMDPGESGYYVAMHEIGHSLGLEHTFAVGLSGAENTEQFSVMAYDLNPWGGIQAETYMLYDIAAIQEIYGANTSYNAGNTTYTLDAFSAYTIWDGGGNDTLDSTNYNGNVILHLEEGGFSSLGLDEHIAIAYDAVIENARSGNGNDQLFGNDANNILNGGAGDDDLYGRAGNDTFIYSSGEDAIFETSGIDRVEFDAVWAPDDVSISGNILTFDASNFLTFNNINLIEFFAFDGFADFTLDGLLNFGNTPVSTDFVATSAAETFNGNGDDDSVSFINGGAVNVDLQNNTARGGHAEGDTLNNIENIIGSDNSSARDFIWGDANDNVIEGMAGADILEGGVGADTIDGGAGWDYARYTRSTSGVNINLDTETHTGGHAAGDTLISIEAIVGSVHNDVIIGDSGNNYFRAENGNDTMNGGLGNDQLIGGNGNDSYIYVGGRDRFTETGSGNDSVTIDNTSFNLSNLVISGNVFQFSAQDTITFNDLSLFETFIIFDPSSSGFLSLSLSGLQDALDGAGNDDVGTSGNDTFIGNSDAVSYDGLGGRDTVDYSNSADAVMVDLLNNVANGGLSQGDQFTSIENIHGSDSASARDFIYGDDAANVIRGLNGNDILEGGKGADVIDGGAGWDYARYTRAESGVRVNLGNSSENTGDAAGDTFISIEAVVGSNFNDILLGGSSNDFLRGGNGDDMLYAGAGRDQLYGDDGADVFIFNSLSQIGNTSPDIIRDFDDSEGDRLDIADILEGYGSGDDLSEFVQLISTGTNRTSLRIDENGMDDGVSSFTVYGDVTGTFLTLNVDALEQSGTLITV